MPLDTTVEVDTPEQVRFRFQVAGPGRRALAYLIDTIISAVIIFGGVLLISLVGGKEGEGYSQGLIYLLLFAVQWGYYVLFESIGGGTTPGRRALKLRVIKEGGYPIGFIDSVLRNLLRFVDFLPFAYLIGFTAAAVDGRFRRLGDRVAGTLVIVEEQQRIASRATLDYAFTDEELEWLPNVVPLKRAELDAIDRLLNRSAQLSPGRARELALLVAPQFAARLNMTLPEDPVRFLALLSRRARGEKFAVAA
jgi:uncharacterized RDD family membrane protein YckC